MQKNRNLNDFSWTWASSRTYIDCAFFDIPATTDRPQTSERGRGGFRGGERGRGRGGNVDSERGAFGGGFGSGFGGGFPAKDGDDNGEVSGGMNIIDLVVRVSVCGRFRP